MPMLKHIIIWWAYQGAEPDFQVFHAEHTAMTFIEVLKKRNVRFELYRKVELDAG